MEIVEYNGKKYKKKNEINTYSCHGCDLMGVCSKIFKACSHLPTDGIYKEIKEDPPTTYEALLGGKYSKWIPLTVDIINDPGWKDRTVRVIGRKEEFKLTGMQAYYENDESSKIYISAKNKSGRELNFHIEFFEIKVEG